MLTVACVFVRGPYPYSAQYVIRLNRMVQRHLSRPFRFVCLTDRADELPADIDTIAVPSLDGMVPHNGVGYWAKLRLFDPALGLVGRCLFLDLDTLVVDALDPIVDFPAPLALTQDAFVVERAHLNTDRKGRRLVRRFNSSVMVWDGGTQSELWTRWSPAVAERLSTDQDWIGEFSEEARAMPLAWFPRLSHLVRDVDFESTGRPMPVDAKVVLVKKPKNHIACEQWPWLNRAWGAA